MSKKKHSPEEAPEEHTAEEVHETEASSPATPELDTVTLRALHNTQLADGTFVAKGEIVTVSRHYAARVLHESPQHFISV